MLEPVAVDAAGAMRAELHGTGVGVSALFPGFIRDAGMFHDSGAKLPGYVGTKTPADVANAVVSAIERGDPRMARIWFDVSGVLVRERVVAASTMRGLLAIRRTFGMT